jgi:N-acetylmuramoyl-L-alanine amidase
LDAFAKANAPTPIEPDEPKAEVAQKPPPETRPSLPPARSGEISLAAQLGLKVRRVVIDPGHGGHDAGAVGKGGTREKDVSLSISRRLAEILEKAGLEVWLTRRDDTFVRLEDRAKFANDNRGDLFISIHCNSARARMLKGVETYSLNTSSNRYSIRLAARENASSERSISDLQYILADLATKANTEESGRLAQRVQQALVSSLRLRHPEVRDLGTKEALFYVLLGTKMPAILVETSYLSNPEEERRLRSKAYQEEIARAIAAGVEEFLESRQQVAKVN